MQEKEQNKVASEIVIAPPLYSSRPILTNSGFSWNGLSVQREICPPPLDRVSEPSIPEHLIILHVANSDRLERRLDGERWFESPSHPGEITIVPAHRTPEWLWDDKVELLNIYLQPELLKTLAQENFDFAAKDVELIDRLATPDPFIHQVASALVSELERPSMASKLYIESLQNVISMHLLLNHSSVNVATSPTLSGGLPQYRLRQVSDYIHDHLDQDLSLAELAAVVQMSSHHFSRLFKQSTGVAPWQYVIRCRVEAAKRLLAIRELSVVAIATRLGFASHSQFTIL